MKFKKNQKVITLVIGIIIGIILVSGISVYATYSYYANEVKYTNEKTVAQALDELYANKKDVSELNTLKNLLNETNATQDDIANGKKAYSNGNLITGIANLEKNWTLVITYKIYLGWNGNTGYGYKDGKITIKNIDGNKTITNENGTITSPTQNWNGSYYINSKISDVTIESFTIDE